MEGTGPVDDNDTSSQSSEEGLNVYKVSNRIFAENVQQCTITLRKQHVEAVLEPINAVLNSGGGIVLMKIDGFSKFKPEDLNKCLDTFWQALQPKLNLMIQPLAYTDVFDQERKGDTILLFIKATEHFCTINYNLRLPGDAALLLPSYNKVVDLLSKRDTLEKEEATPQVLLTDLPMHLLPKQFIHKKVLNFHESKQVQLKHYESQHELFHNNNQKAQDEIAKNISAFGNGSGGMILMGIKNNGKVLGQNIEGERKAKLESGFQAMINQMSETWSFTPKQGVHWDIKFFPVAGTASSSVIVILIAGMQNLGGIFTKCPKSFELQNPSGSDGEEKIVCLDFPEWEQRMLCGTCKGESKGIEEVRKKLEIVSITNTLKGPLLTVQGSVEEIQNDFFPVGPRCPLSPKGFELNLPKTAQQVIRQIQEQNSEGRDRALLVASPSMLSSVLKEKHSKKDGVICDLLLFNGKLGGLHLFTLVNSGPTEQFLPYAHATAKTVKKSLVMSGGCFEKFYITCHVVPCNREGTEPLDKLSPDRRYPKEYDLQSSRGKINEILRSLVIVLAQFPCFLSNKQGLSFLSLLTKQQFRLLYELCKEDRELWIHGAAGTGKTVVAVEFIRELLRRDLNLRPGNILYVCENLGILAKIRKLNICECRTRQAFMKEEFPHVRHVILDEVQNFRAENGDWLGKAKRLVRQHASDCESDGDFDSEQESNSDANSVAELDAECSSGQGGGPGYLWCFIDRNQINHRFSTGIPCDCPRPFRLKKVIRTSKEIFNFAKKLLRKEAVGELEIGHDFDGEEIRIVEYPEGQQIAWLIKELKSLLKEGYSTGDIAILFGKQESFPEDIQYELLKRFGLTVDAESDDDDTIVLSTFRKYSGLERPVVIAVDITTSLTEYSLPKPSIYCAATRAMVKLVFLLEKRGQKRKPSN